MNRLTDELDSRERKFGSGWISGFSGVLLGGLGLATVLCIRYPQFLTFADIREHYHLPLIRLALQLVLISGFCMGIISVVLRRQKTLGFTALILVMLASLLGGSHAAMRFEVESDYYLGLDFFVLNLIFLGAIFIPIERLFKQNDQPVLRYEWREDLLYFFVSTLFVQILTFLSLAPSMAVLAKTTWAGPIREVIRSQPLLLQFIEIMFFTDLVQYWVHRIFHQTPWLWKFHAVHHSAQAMDWLAGSRMHVIEIIVLRGLTTMPMYVIGFAEPALYAYIFFVYILSVFIHSNLRFKFGFLNYIIATPRFHHWHHGIEKEAIDVNFAIHFPVIDMVFGTFHMPRDKWPEGYGIQGHPVPKGFWGQFLYPFVPSKEKQAEE